MDSFSRSRRVEPAFKVRNEVEELGVVFNLLPNLSPSLGGWILNEDIPLEAPPYGVCKGSLRGPQAIPRE
jgi:hypothetical protein